jgi:hypothetical protein
MRLFQENRSRLLPEPKNGSHPNTHRFLKNHHHAGNGVPRTP